VPKVILAADISGTREPLSFSDARWARITSHIPAPLSAEADARLRSAIMVCCSWYLTQRARLEEGTATAAAMRAGKRQPSPFERLAKGLRMAADAWAKLGKIHDDRLGDVARYATLEAMAGDAERRLAAFRKLGKPITMAGPWPLFVRKIARSCRAAGLNPTVTGRIYEHGKATWFQNFMAALNENLLGLEGKGRQLEYNRDAFHAEIAKALRGDKKPGKARK
jgi:hypothetical protein